MDGTTAPEHWVGHTQCVRLYQDIFQVSLPKRRSPTRPVRFSAGRHRPSWFNIRTLPPGHDEWDEAGIASSVAYVEALIQAEIHHGVDPHHIILMGFSQGAALSFMVALTATHQLGGVISLSGWIPHKGRDVSHNRTAICDECSDDFLQQITLTEPHFPIFCGQGRDDTEIPTYYAEEAMGFLRNVLCFRETHLTIKQYDGLAHAVM